MNYSPNVTFEYNLKKKRRFAYTTFFILGLLFVLALLYILVFQTTEMGIVSNVRSAVLHIFGEISNKTLLGLFYTSAIGGLFFVTISLEAVFLTFLDAGYSPVVLIGMYLFGLFISYTINYYLGLRLRSLVQKAITYKKFYKIKGFINKYGTGAIFVFNVLPLPSQPLSAILGVFKYNKVKFYIFFLLGQFVKYTVIVIGAKVIGVA